MTGPLLLADWGTTNRRSWLIGEHGQTLASIEDRCGMATVEPGGWEPAFDELKRALGCDEPRLSLLAGMVGADRGWREVPYVPCPAGLDDLAGGLCWVEPGRVAIVPGVSWLDGISGDMMRGEETQVLGAVAAGLAPADCFACLPGTHTKWIAVRGGRIAALRTVMTGELFALLKDRSLLADQLRDLPAADADFDAGLERGLSGRDLTTELFVVRSNALLGTRRIGNAGSYVSGLLIGADLHSGLELSDEREVHVIGRSDLALLYAAALERSGYRVRRIGGGEAVVAGLLHLVERVQ